MSSSAAAAPAAAAAPSRVTGSVLIKRAGDEHARFARVPVHADDAVTDLAARAARELEWRASAAYVTLFLVKRAVGSDLDFDKPTQAQIDAALADERGALDEGYSALFTAPAVWFALELIARYL